MVVVDQLRAIVAMRGRVTMPGIRDIIVIGALVGVMVGPMGVRMLPVGVGRLVLIMSFSNPQRHERGQERRYRKESSSALG